MSAQILFFLVHRNLQDYTEKSMFIARNKQIVGQTRFFSLGEATCLGEEKLWIQTC